MNTPEQFLKPNDRTPRREEFFPGEKVLATGRERPAPFIDVALVEPEIPWNTGNVGRTCLGLGARLHLAGKLGFSLDDSHLKRAGLDYWPLLNAQVHPDADHFLSGWDSERLFFFSARAEKPYWEARYMPGALLVFGAETRGLPAALRRRHPDRFFTIPLAGPIRSLNLSTAVGMVLGEALRQRRTSVSPARRLRRKVV